MDNIIIGSNCSGKTRFLKDKYIEAKLSGKDIVSNFNDYKFREDSFITEKIRKFLRVDEIKFEAEDVVIDDYIEYTDEFKSVIKLLCCKSDVVFIDEPEIGFLEVERHIFTDMLIYLSSIKEIWITTNIIAVLNIHNANIYSADIEEYI